MRCFVTNNPTSNYIPPAPPSKYIQLRNSQINRIAYLQDLTPNGAIPLDAAYMSDLGYYVNPYFGAIAARAFLLREATYDRCKRYLEWMILSFRTDNANENLPYTIPDYWVATDGTQTIRTIDGSTCDSVDSYSALFLSLLYEYCSKVNDYSLYTKNAGLVDSVANTLNFLRDSTGLTPAKPSYLQHYAMDNSEVYDGYNKISKLYTAVGKTSKASDYSYAAAVIFGNIESKLWSYGGNYRVSLENDANIVGPFYPNLMCQYVPLMFDAVSPAIEESRYNVICGKLTYYANQPPTLMMNHLQYWNVYPEFDPFPHVETMYWTARSLQKFGLTKWTNWCVADRVLNPYTMFDAISYRIANNYNMVYAQDSAWTALACDILEQIGEVM